MDEDATPKNPFRAVKSYFRCQKAIRTDTVHMIRLEMANTYDGTIKLSGMDDHVLGDASQSNNPVPKIMSADIVYVMEDNL